MFYGILDLPWWGYLVTILTFTHITMASVTIYLHRHQAHRALTLHSSVSHFFRAWLWLTSGMNTKAWTAIHRKHHAKCETDEDPHSPKIYGITTVLLEGAELYKREACNTETLERYGQGTPDDWLERNLYTPYSRTGVITMLVANILLFGVPGITVWAVQMMWNPLFAAGIINGIGHYWGYRNFECPDAATNVMPWGILIGGEELHNNHHTFPTSAKLSVRWFEFDIGWFYIQILASLGLAKVKRVPPKASINLTKKQIDVDTLVALLSNQIQIMTSYSKLVILPLFKQEKSNAQPKTQRLLKRMKSALFRADILIDAADKQYLPQFLESNQVLQLVYNYGERLKSIWNKHNASQKELLDALHEWCRQAEATGLQRLQEFSQYLKGYTLKPANT